MVKKPLFFTSLRILVVDDCPDSTESLRMLCNLWGYEVRTANDGPSALKAAEDFRPHVVLLDIGLPRLSGYDVARRLREFPGAEKMFVIAITGFGRQQDRDLALESGFDLHLTKPVDPKLLEDFLSKIVVGAGSCVGRIV